MWISLLMGFAYAVLLPCGVGLVRLATRVALIENRVTFVEQLELKLDRIDRSLVDILVKLARLEKESKG